MSLEEQLENQNHIHWYRGCLGFKYLRDGLVQTVDTIVKNQHIDFMKNLVCSGCNQCSLNTLSPSHGRVGNSCREGRSKCFCLRSKIRRPCPNSFCGHVYDSIVTYHKYSDPNWSNTNLANWGSSYLEIAKCFINSGGYKDKHNIEYIDCSGLLSIIINNRAFESSVTGISSGLDPSALFIQARNDRNDLFHTSNMELSEDRLKNMTDNMLRILNLTGIIDTEGKTKLSRENIQKVRDGNITISVNDKKDFREECGRNIEYKHRKQGVLELQTKLCDYYKRCLSTIPVSPVLKTISGTVDEAFVEFSIRKNLTDEQNSDDFEQVNFYEEILFKNDTLCKSVYLLGEAGMGKTTWCKKFLNTWMKACRARTTRSTSALETDRTLDPKEEHTNEVDTDIACLRQFDIVFYIALRQQSNHIHIADMVKHHPVVSEYSMQTIVEDVLKNEPQSCIIVLDGLDEWEPQKDVEIPSRKDLHGCTVVTTSRRYRLVGIDEMDDSFLPDMLVEMTGIRNKELLIKNVIRQLNIGLKKGHKEKDSSEEDSRRFIADVKRMKDREISFQKTLPAYMEIPLMLIVMVCFWFDKGKIEDTLTKNIAGMIEFMFKYAEGFQTGKNKNKKRKKEGEKIHELKEEWSKSAGTLPCQLRQKDVLVPYSGLVFKVSKLAFESFFNPDFRIRLTFSEEDLLRYFSEDELDVAMKIGILSQSEVTESALCPMTTLSFIHKTFHEYLAGVYLTIQFTSLTEKSITTANLLAEYFKNHGRYLLDIDNAICVVGGTDPKAASKMSKVLYEILKPSPEVFDTESVEYFNDFYLRQVQVVHENDENYPTVEFPIYTEFISVPNKLEEGKMKYLHLLCKTNIGNLRKVQMPAGMAPAVLENFRGETISEMLKLSFYDLIPNTEGASVIRALRCVPELQYLELRGISGNYPESAEQVCLDLANTRLKKVELKELSNITILVNGSIEVECDDVTKYEIRVQNE